VVKTRVLLGLIIGGVGLLNFLVYESGLKIDYAMCFYFFTPFLALAALVMLIFSLFRVHTTPEGGLAYDPSNPYWRLMRYCWNDIFWKECNVSLCKAFWLTVMSTVLAITALFMAWIIGIMVYLALSHQLKPFDWSKNSTLLIAAGSFVGPLVLAMLVIEKSYKTGRAILSLWAVWCFVVGPVILIMHKDQLGLTVAILQYLKVAIPFAVGLSAFFWSMVQLEKRLPSLMNTAFGQFLIALKQNYCPMLTEAKTE